MIKAEQIPDDVVEALKDAANQWAMWLTDEEVRAALAAGLAAWPLAKPCAAFFGDQSVEHTDEHVEKHMRRALILPLQKNSDGK
jgi:phage gp16-like protein